MIKGDYKTVLFVYKIRRLFIMCLTWNKKDDEEDNELSIDELEFLDMMDEEE